MPNLDTSDFIRRLKLGTIAKANALADPRKFRAPTRDSTYDPYRTITKNISFDDRYLEKKHYVFTASGGGKSTAPENAGGGGGNTITIPSNYCESPSNIQFTAGVTYAVINNSMNTTFALDQELGIFFSTGTSQFTPESDLLMIGCLG